MLTEMARMSLDDGLVMQQLHYADEVHSIGEVPLGTKRVKDEELALARQIIEQAINDKFEPEKYEDEVRKRMLRRIEMKVEGQEITDSPEEAPKAQVIDLMEALKASLDKKSGSRQPARASKREATGSTKAKATKKAAAKKRAKS